MGGRSRTIIGATLALGLLTPSAAAAEAMYSWKSETRAFSYTKKVCQSNTHTVTEVITQEIFNRSSGVSAAGGTGGPARLPRGSSQSSGRIRRNYSKVVQGPDAVPPEDWTITESLPLFGVDWGSITRAGKGKGRLDVGLVDAEDEQSFALPKKRKSTVTLSIDVPDKETTEDDGRCVITSRGNVKGTVTITRIR